MALGAKFINYLDLQQETLMDLKLNQVLQEQ